MQTEEVTISQVFKALEANGFQHIRQEWTAETVHGVIKGGCILQQGALNLNVLATSDEYSLVEQLNQFKTTNNPRKVPQGLADAIISWNDKYELTRDEKGNSIPLKAGGWKKTWELKSYKAVVAKAREILEPFFDEPITLKKHQWTYQRKDGTVNI